MPSAVRYATALAIWVIVILGLMVLVTISKSEAHDWYVGKSDPVTNASCCGGHDCGPVPLDVGWVQPVAGGFRVLMSLEEARLVNKNATAGIDAFVPWDRVMSPPNKADGPPALYHVCIVGNKLYCLFVVPGI